MESIGPKSSKFETQTEIGMNRRCATRKRRILLHYSSTSSNFVLWFMQS